MKKARPVSVILYEHPLSPYAQKNKIALREKGVAFSVSAPPGLGAGGNEDYAALNPRVEVPALEHDGCRIFDSTIIQEYIEETWPTPALMPASPAARARQRMIEEVVDTQYEAITWGFMEVAVFGRAPGELGESLVANGRRQLAGLHAWLERELGAGPYFNGESCGWADVAAIPFVMGAVAYRSGPERGSALSDWYGRMLQRPSVAQTAVESREAATAVNTGAPRAVAAGVFKREYRDHRLEWMIRSGGLQVVADGLAAGNIRFSRELG